MDGSLVRKIVAFLDTVEVEAREAACKHKPMNSLHEAYAVIAEEVDELWDEVRKKASARRPEDVAMELRQIAAMAVRAAVDLGYVR